MSLVGLEPNERASRGAGTCWLPSAPPLPFQRVHCKRASSQANRPRAHLQTSCPPEPAASGANWACTRPRVLDVAGVGRNVVSALLNNISAGKAVRPARCSAAVSWSGSACTMGTVDIEEGKQEAEQPAKSRSGCFAGCSRLLNTLTALCAILCIVALSLAIAVGPHDRVSAPVLSAELAESLRRVVCYICKMHSALREGKGFSASATAGFESL